MKRLLLAAALACTLHASAQTLTRPAQDPVIELRQYTMLPGQREVLIDLFDRFFVDSQEALGMPIIGQFRQVDAPDRFVWLRSFASMPAREKALNDFYYGPVWKAHRNQANPTIVDAANVLLLKPARPGSGFADMAARRAPAGSTAQPAGLVVATLWFLKAPASDLFITRFEQVLAPIAKAHGARVDAYLVTEPAANNFPALPIREGEHVFAWFATFKDRAAYDRYATQLAGDWARAYADHVAPQLAGPPDVLLLAPTAQSAWHD